MLSSEWQSKNAPMRKTLTRTTFLTPQTPSEHVNRPTLRGYSIFWNTCWKMSQSNSALLLFLLEQNKCRLYNTTVYLPEPWIACGISCDMRETLWIPCMAWWQLYLADTAEHKGLALVIPVGSHSQVHLLRVGVLLKGLAHPQDGIGGTHLHSTPPWAATKSKSGDEDEMAKTEQSQEFICVLKKQLLSLQNRNTNVSFQGDEVRRFLKFSWPYVTLVTLITRVPVIRRGPNAWD